MTTTSFVLERELVNDLEALADRFADEEFCRDLYRALASNIWCGPDGHLAFSSRRAEQLVNDLRTRLTGRRPLPLAVSGGEGEISPLVEDELDRLSWRAGAFCSEGEDDGLPAADAPPTRARRVAYSA